MIMVIDGKRYNTETSEMVYRWMNGCFYGDFRFRLKNLYRTRNGAWFIYHEGGAMTDMAISVGSNGRGGSSKIEPVSKEDAFGFLQAHSDESDALEAIEKYFADSIQDA